MELFCLLIKMNVEVEANLFAIRVGQLVVLLQDVAGLTIHCVTWPGQLANDFEILNDNKMTKIAL